MIEYRDEDKTDWFPGAVEPVRDGVYERRYYGDDADIDASKFRSGFWHRGRRTIGEALSEIDISGYQADYDNASFEWRGLKADPNTVVIKPEVHVVAHNVPGLALDSGEFIPAEELNKVQHEEDLF